MSLTVATDTQMEVTEASTEFLKISYVVCVAEMDQNLGFYSFANFNRYMYSFLASKHRGSFIPQYEKQKLTQIDLLLKAHYIAITVKCNTMKNALNHQTIWCRQEYKNPDFKEFILLWALFL